MLDIMIGRENIKVDYEPGKVVTVQQHDGTYLRLRKLNDEYDPSDRLAAQNFLARHAAKGEVVTGLLYIDPEADDLHAHSNTVETAALNALVRRQPGPELALDKMNAGLR